MEAFGTVSASTVVSTRRMADLVVATVRLYWVESACSAGT